MRFFFRYELLIDLVSCPAPFAKREEGVWTKVYRARVTRAAWSARQSDARKKSHDYVSM